MAKFAIAGIFILAIACGVGFGAASADSTDDLARAGAFGFDEETHIATLATAPSEGSASSLADTGTSGQQALEMSSARDIAAGLAMVDQRQAAEEARTVAENTAAMNRVAEKKEQQGVEAKPTAAAQSKKEKTEEQKVVEELLKQQDLDEYDLPAVDWSVGKKAFIETWTARIDAYLEGTPLSGYGSVFAEAAWNNGIDPRWSPAISNTESGNGTHCFLPHNAWGWGNDSAQNDYENESYYTSMANAIVDAGVQLALLWNFNAVEGSVEYSFSANTDRGKMLLSVLADMNAAYEEKY